MYALDTVCDAIVQPVLGSGWLRSETHNANACCKKKKKNPIMPSVASIVLRFVAKKVMGKKDFIEIFDILITFPS